MHEKESLSSTEKGALAVMMKAWVDTQLDQAVEIDTSQLQSTQTRNAIVEAVEEE